MHHTQLVFNPAKQLLSGIYKVWSFDDLGDLNRGGNIILSPKLMVNGYPLAGVYFRNNSLDNSDRVQRSYECHGQTFNSFGIVKTFFVATSLCIYSSVNIFVATCLLVNSQLFRLG